MRRAGHLAVLLLLLVALSAQSFPLNNFDSGTQATPSRAYRVDPQLGSYRIQQGNEGFTADGVLRWHYSTSLLHLTSGVDFYAGGTGVFQGAVGIGRNSPAVALHVVGSTAITGALDLSGPLGINVTATSTLHVVGTLAVTGATSLYSSLTLGNASQVLTPDGTAAAPSLAPASETGNGLYRQAASFAGVSQNLHVAGHLHVQTSLNLGAHVVTVALNGVAAENVEILQGQRSLYLIDCNDTDGCTLHLGTTGITPGSMTTIVNIGVNGLRLFDVATTNIMHINGALFLMTTNHTISFTYVRNRSGAAFWTEIARQPGLYN